MKSSFVYMLGLLCAFVLGAMLSRAPQNLYAQGTTPTVSPILGNATPSAEATALAETTAEVTPESTGEAAVCNEAAENFRVQDVNRAAYFVGLGDAFFAQSDYTRAIFNYSCALLSFPDYVPAYINRGYAHATQRNDPAAFDDYTRALELAPESVEAYNNRGLLYTARGSFAAALADFDLALALDPNFAVGYLNRAIVHAAEANYALAIADIEFALQLAPDLPAAHAALGAVRLAQSLESYREYVRLAEAAGFRSTFPPGGDAESLLPALRSAYDAGTFTPWLPLQLPAR
ncbi:MAG: tetratricopeptide repeat protein [bacterium]|nr:tetratricopeptide repeat protein [bacterium]